MSIHIALAGATGYAGGEILRLLLLHPAYHRGDLTIGSLCAHSQAGRDVAEVMPHLGQLAARKLSEITAEALAGHDVVFLALPHGHSAAVAQQLPAHVLVIDCSADFRIQDPTAWEDYYGTPHAGAWPYGLPELPGQRETIASTRRVAVPGCFPTAFTLAAYPALQGGLVEPNFDVVAVTGLSGAGKKAAVEFSGSESIGNLRAYSPGGTHRHTPEMIQNLAELAPGVTVSFTPILAPMTRGILATVSAPLAGGAAAAEVEDLARCAYTKAYAAEPFCHLLPSGVQPQVGQVVGANFAHIQVHVDAVARRLIMTCAIDNLVKGTAGAAVQCLNLALGWEETAGLKSTAVVP